MVSFVFTGEHLSSSENLMADGGHSVSDDVTCSWMNEKWGKLPSTSFFAGCTMAKKFSWL